MSVSLFDGSHFGGGKAGIPKYEGPVRYPGFARVDYLSKLSFPELNLAINNGCDLEILSQPTVEYFSCEIKLIGKVDLVILPDKRITATALDLIPEAQRSRLLWYKENLEERCIDQGCSEEVVRKIFALRDSHLLGQDSGITLAHIDRICDVIMDYFEDILSKHAEKGCNLLILADPIIVGLLDVGFMPDREYMARHHPITTSMPSFSTMFLK